MPADNNKLVVTVTIVTVLIILRLLFRSILPFHVQLTKPVDCESIAITPTQLFIVSTHVRLLGCDKSVVWNHFGYNIQHYSITEIIIVKNLC